MTLVLTGDPERVVAATEQIKIMSEIPGIVFVGSLGRAATEATLFPDREVEWPLDTYAPDITGEYDTRPRDIDVIAPFGGLTLDQLRTLFDSGLHPVDTVVQSHLIPSLWGHELGKSLLLPIKGFPRTAGRVVMRDIGGGMRIPTLAAEAQAIVGSLGPAGDEKHDESAQRLRKMVAELRRRPDTLKTEFLGQLTKLRLRRLKWID